MIDAENISFRETARLRYVLDFLERHPNCPDGLRFVLNPPERPSNAVFCRYGYNPDAGMQANVILIPAQKQFLPRAPFHIRHFWINPYSFEGRTLYAVENRKNRQANPFLTRHETSAFFGFDWIETLFFQISRFEEYVAGEKDLDEIGIMRSTAMLFPSQGLHHIPAADKLADAVYESLGFVPKCRSTTLSISHDVDSLELFGSAFNLPRFLLGTALRFHTARAWPQVIRDWFRVRRGIQPDPGFTFDRLFKLAGADTPKTIYFGVASGRPFDCFPDLDRPEMKNLAHRATAAAYRIGIHPGFETWKSGKQFKSQLMQLSEWLGEDVRLSRQHYLRFAFPETADLLEQNGILEDSSLGFRDRAGFRAGTGFPFQLYDFQHERAYRWVENPLVAMDWGVVREWGRDARMLEAGWAQFAARNREGTAVTINIHNTFLYDFDLHDIDFSGMMVSEFRKK